MIARINRCFFEIVVNLSLLQPIFARMNWHRPWWTSEIFEVVQPFGRAIWCYMHVGRVHGRISKMRRLHMNRLVLLLYSSISGWFVCLWVLYLTHSMEKVSGPWSETSQHGDFEKKAGNKATQRRKTHVPFQTSNWFFGNWRSIK